MCEPTFPLSMLADFSRESYAKGYTAGVAAAREAVAALESRYDWPAVYGPEALAAIDALREKP